MRVDSKVFRAAAGAVGAYEGEALDPPHLAFRLRAPEIIGRGSCLLGDWNMLRNQPGTCERLKKPRARNRRGGHAYSPG